MTRIIGAQVFNSSTRAFAARDVLVDGDRITDVVSPRRAHCEMPESARLVVDATGRYLVPGFVDAHFHLLALALRRLRCNLSAADGADDVYHRIREFATRGEGAVVGVEWDESRWAKPDVPTRAGLDAVSTSRPVLVRRICCHVGVANRVLLDRLTAPARCVDRESGRIVEQAVAEATRLTAPRPERIQAAVEPAIGELHALGITGIHDIVEGANFDAWLGGLCGSRLPLRVDALLHVAFEHYDHYADRIATAATPGAAASTADRPAPAHPLIHVRGIKMFSDGSLGAHTAALCAPYADRDTTGELLLEPDALRETLVACARRERVCAVHAIGDRAIAVVAKAMRDAREQSGGHPAFRIEHAELPGPSQLDEIEAAGAALVMQPNFVRNWAAEGGLYQTRLGRRRWLTNNPFRAVMDRNIPLAFSSDGMPPGPLFGMGGATGHPVAAHALSPGEALGAYTAGAWGLPGHRQRAGKIEGGMAADLVLLAGNPLDGAASPRVEAVWVAGKAVFPG